MITRRAIVGRRFAFPTYVLAIVVLTNLVGANPQRFVPQIAELYNP